MKKNKTFILVFDLAILIVLFWISRNFMPVDTSVSEAPPTLTLAALAYTEHPYSGYTVYIEECTGYQPYYVLTGCYNGQDGAALLLRKHLLENPREYHPYTGDETYSAYYENSSIDQFLNSEFLGTLPTVVQQQVLDSTITVAAKSAIASLGHETLNITRKVFLLSLTELGFDFGIIEIEGTPLQKNPKTHEEDLFHAINQTKELSDWWSRSPLAWGTRVEVWALTPRYKSIYNATTNKQLGVRPAFCLPGDLPIEWRLEVSGYVIQWQES